MAKKVSIFQRLSDEQRITYDTLKKEIRAEIQSGLEAFQRAGEKLLMIREERLYREEFDTFEEFCRSILGHSKTYANNLIIGFELVQDLIAQGVTVLPDNEHVARELAKYPKTDRAMIMRRAVQIADRSKPTYKTIREAAREIVVSKEVQKVFMSEFLGRLRTARKALTVSVDFSTASVESMKTIASLLVSIEKACAELSIHAGKRIDEIKRKGK